MLRLCIPTCTIRLCLPRGRDHALALPDVVAGRLLAVHVFARLAGPDRGERVPVIWGRDRDGVDLFILVKLAEVVVDLGLAALRLFGKGHGALGLRLVHVADGGYLCVALFGDVSNVRPAASSHAHNGDIDPVVRSQRAKRHGAPRDKSPALHTASLSRSAPIVLYTATMLRFFGLAALMAGIAFGQLDSNSVTVTASRTQNAAPDQALFGIFVDAPPDATLDDVLAVLQGSGVTMANFAGVGNAQLIQLPPAATPDLEWSFALPVPLSKTKETVASLTALRNAIAAKRNGMTLSFSVQGTQASAQAVQALACPTADLIADARAQAQKLADAAGLTLGPILALSSATTGNSSAGGAIYAAISVSRFIQTAPTIPSICALTVKFGLTRY